MNTVSANPLIFRQSRYNHGFEFTAVIIIHHALADILFFEQEPLQQLSEKLGK
jgi:hypothetical protein